MPCTHYINSERINSDASGPAFRVAVRKQCAPVVTYDVWDAIPANQLCAETDGIQAPLFRSIERRESRVFFKKRACTFLGAGLIGFSLFFFESLLYRHEWVL